MPNDILFQSAKIWETLLDHKYILTVGYKKQLHIINITFSKKDFSHLAGFQYLKDLPILKLNSTQILTKILERKITYEQVNRGILFAEMVEPRLNALIHLKEILDNDFTLFTYIPKFYSFATTIKADYLLSSNIGSKHFVFILRTHNIQNTDNSFLCCSAFTKGDRDYESNQRKRTLLKKERIHIPTNTSTILFNKLYEP